LAVFLKRFQARIGQVLEEVDPRKETYVEHTDRPWVDSSQNERGLAASRTQLSYYQPLIARVLTLTNLAAQSRASLRNCDFESPAERRDISVASLRSYPE